MPVSRSKLADPIFKQMLMDIEESNLLREDVTFGNLCHTHPRCYDANEDLKKKCANEFDQIKRKTQAAYINLLDTLSVPLGPALQRVLRLKNKPVSSSKKPRQASSGSSSSSSSSSSGSSSEESVAKVTQHLKSISIPKEIHQNFTPEKTDRIEATPPMSSLKKKQIMFSPDAESTTSNPIADVLNYVEMLESIRQDGTLDCPFIHIVNDFAERNRGFDIVLVPEIEHGGCTRDALHIGITVSVGNAQDLEASVPTVPDILPWLLVRS